MHTLVNLILEYYCLFNLMSIKARYLIVIDCALMQPATTCMHERRGNEMDTSDVYGPELPKREALSGRKNWPESAAGFLLRYMQQPAGQLTGNPAGKIWSATCKTERFKRRE